MTPEMIAQAREDAAKQDYTNVEFRLGGIESLPVADNSVDVAISNCVINLSPDKRSVFQEAFRSLKPGGRMSISDIVLLTELSESVKGSVAAYVGCVAGAMLRDDYLTVISEAGFEEIRVIEETTFPVELIANDSIAKTIAKDLEAQNADLGNIASSIVSIKIQVVKPGAVI